MSKFLTIALSALSFLGAPALAGETVAVIIDNPTDVEVEYEISINNPSQTMPVLPWYACTVPPGGGDVKYWTLVPGDKFTIRFDSIFGDGKVTYRYYTLRFGPEHSGGNRYVFERSADGRQLDLRTAD